LKTSTYKIVLKGPVKIEKCHCCERKFLDGALEINYSSESIKLFKREDIDHDDLDYHLADIAEVGIGKCLKQWNKGITICHRIIEFATWFRQKDINMFIKFKIEIFIVVQAYIIPVTREWLGENNTSVLDIIREF